MPEICSLRQSFGDILIRYVSEVEVELRKSELKMNSSPPSSLSFLEQSSKNGLGGGVDREPVRSVSV